MSVYEFSGALFLGFAVIVLVLWHDKLYLLVCPQEPPKAGDLYMKKIWKGNDNPFFEKPRVVVVDIQNGWIKFKGYREAGLVIGSDSCKVSRFLCDYMKA
jgi:hypothetical protein